MDQKVKKIVNVAQRNQNVLVALVDILYLKKTAHRKLIIKILIYIILIMKEKNIMNAQLKKKKKNIVSIVLKKQNVSAVLLDMLFIMKHVLLKIILKIMTYIILIMKGKFIINVPKDQIN